jgi:diaminopimelate epimerase
MRFYKYHALGNDYLVLNPADFPSWGATPTRAQIRVICHRNFGVGSDGILWGPLPSPQSEHGLRIFNPDGSEAEKSGNGVRIFSRFLWDQGLVKTPCFTLETPGGQVQSVIKEQGRLITVAMGRVSFDSAKIPVNVAGAPREVLNETITVLDRQFTYCAATIGNPHCVIPLDDISPDLAHRYGPHLETHPIFPRKTNVQFLKVRDRQNIKIEI